MQASTLMWHVEIAPELRVNGVDRFPVVNTRTTLLDALRNSFHLPSTQKGSHQGACAACAVIVDTQRRVVVLRARDHVRRSGSPDDRRAVTEWPSTEARRHISSAAHFIAASVHRVRSFHGLS